VQHTHSRALVALTLQGVWRTDDVLPPITPYQVMKVGHVPLIAYRRPGDPEVADAVAAAIDARASSAPIRAVLLERLGPLVWHRTPAQAMALLEELEETAVLWQQCGRAVAPLEAPRIDELRRVFGAAW
jgi:ribulose-5-phosphate 4-epimerase/fuculose-1-phosphate aldolase